VTHGACTNLWALYDPSGFFSRLRDAALSHPDEVFQQVILDGIVGEICERIGKVRNTRAANDDACLPYLAVELARCGDLAGAARIADASDAFWSGVERWAGGRGIQIEQDLERLLKFESKGGSGTMR
jgi:hypothetical protein